MTPADVSSIVRNHVRSALLGEATGHDWWLVFSVTGLAAKISETD